jgi:hypothetical protein
MSVDASKIAAEQHPGVGNGAGPPASARRRSWQLRARNHWGFYIIATAALLAFLTLVAWATRFGPGMSPDSILYLVTAHHFAATGTFTQFDRAPLTLFPPGYPATLGSLFDVGVSVDHAVRIIGIVAATIVVLSTYRLTKTMSDSVTTSAIATVLVAVMPALLLVDMMLWSEPLFAAAVVAELCFLAHVAKIRRLQIPNLVVVVLLAWYATSLRYIGVSVLPVVFIAVFLASYGQAAARRALYAAGVTVASSLAVVGIVARNIRLGSPAFGDHGGAGLGVNPLFSQTFQTVGALVVPQRLWGLQVPAGFVIVVGCVGALCYAIVRRNRAAVVASSFVAFYLLALSYTELTSQIDPIGQRLIAPCIPPMIAVLSWAVHDVCRRVAKHSLSRRLRVTLLVCGALALALVVASNVQQTTAEANRPAAILGYDTAANLDSPLTLAVRAIPVNVGIAATDANSLYPGSLHNQWLPMPIKPVGCSLSCLHVIAAPLVTSVRQGVLRYLVYLRTSTPSPSVPPPSVPSPSDLRRIGLRLSLVHAYPEGSIYSVSLG